MQQFLDFLSGAATRAIETYGQIQSARYQARAQQQQQQQQPVQVEVKTGGGGQSISPWIMIGAVAVIGVVLVVVLMRK